MPGTGNTPHPRNFHEMLPKGVVFLPPPLCFLDMSGFAAFRSPPKPGVEQDHEPRPMHSPAELVRAAPNIPGGHVMHALEGAAPQDRAQQPNCPAVTPVLDLAQACLVPEDMHGQPEELSHAILDGESPD